MQALTEIQLLKYLEILGIYKNFRPSEMEIVGLEYFPTDFGRAWFAEFLQVHAEIYPEHKALCESIANKSGENKNADCKRIAHALAEKITLDKSLVSLLVRAEDKYFKVNQFKAFFSPASKNIVQNIPQPDYYPGWNLQETINALTEILNDDLPFLTPHNKNKLIEVWLYLMQDNHIQLECPPYPFVLNYGSYVMDWQEKKIDLLECFTPIYALPVVQSMYEKNAHDKATIKACQRYLKVHDKHTPVTQINLFEDYRSYCYNINVSAYALMQSPGIHMNQSRRTLHFLEDYFKKYYSLKTGNIVVDSSATVSHVALVFERNSLAEVDRLRADIQNICEVYQKQYLTEPVIKKINQGNLQPGSGLWQEILQEFHDFVQVAMRHNALQKMLPEKDFDNTRKKGKI